jgi:exonuclease VII small subunit
MTSSFSEQFTGLYATPELVGRKDILKQFERILRDPSPAPRLVFLHGVGGIGKTRLLKKALEMARGLEDCRAAEDVMDFYHIGLHTPIGLSNAIFEILTPPFDCFQAYQSAYQALNRARLSGNVVELGKLREDATNKFDQDLKQLSASKRVVLALDTAERIVYGLKDWSEEIPFAESWEWLVERLPAWQNVTIFVAGREEAIPAIEKMKAQKAVKVEEIEVGSFSLEESLEYFEKVARLLEEKKELQLAERLTKLPLDLRKGAHAYSQGRPILLSLLVDYLSFPGEEDVPLILHQMPPSHITVDDSRRYEEALFARLQKGELGDTLIALGRVPKGADEELLAALLKTTLPEARKRLEAVKNLSVVKIRPEDQRVFLHDEMYAFLQRQVYDSPYDAENQKAAFEIIKDYYKKQRERISQQLNELYAPVEEQGRESLDLKALGEAHTQYQTLLTETMYYYLRDDLGRGFRAWYRFSHEAIMARDMPMDLQLQAELLSYLSRPPAPIIEKNISIRMILENLKTRPPAQDWALAQYTTGVSNAHTILEKVKKDWQKNYQALLASLHAWTASLHIMRGEKGDYDEAELHLQKVYDLLPEKEVNQPFLDLLYPDTLLWHKKATAALAHRVHGYLQRVKGLKDAVDQYQKAAVLLREIDLRIEMATVMNDMGFAQAELGLWHDARSNVSDALRLRRELGPRVPVALSLNTLAAIQVREGQYADARHNSERALSIFRAFSHTRGIGMALVTLAEATRRYAGTTPPLLPVEKRIDLLRQARDYAREADTYFMEIGEKSRQVDALIEIGCACRDWVWRLIQSPRSGDSVERLYRESRDALSEAAKFAEEVGLTYRKVDALVNMAWLEFFMLGTEEISERRPLSDVIQKTEHAIQKAAASFPDESDIDKQPQLWPQKGKLNALKGHLAFYRSEQIRKQLPKGMTKEIENALIEMAENYARSLDYSSRFSPDYQGIRQGKDGMSERLKGLNAPEMRVVCNRIQELYPKGSVIQTFLTNRALWQTGTD